MQCVKEVGAKDKGLGFYMIMYLIVDWVLSLCTYASFQIWLYYLYDYMYIWLYVKLLYRLRDTQYENTQHDYPPNKSTITELDSTTHLLASLGKCKAQLGRLYDSSPNTPGCHSLSHWAACTWGRWRLNSTRCTWPGWRWNLRRCCWTSTRMWPPLDRRRRDTSLAPPRWLRHPRWLALSSGTPGRLGSREILLNKQ